MAGKGDENLPDSGPESFFFFYGSNTPFSQHHPSEFIVDGVTFNCAEQYMMYGKAVQFGDDDMKEKIMATADPKAQKKFGRSVRNFDKEVWDSKCEEVVKIASKAKFSQSEHLKRELLATYPKTLVEASPRDCIWGIGFSEKNPKAKDKKQWRGKNKLGYILTEVRDELRQEESK